MQRTPWIERTFHFDLPEGWIYNVQERLLGTPPRIKAMINGLTEEQLCAKPGNAWSVKEHVGHLIDLEMLHEGRIDDFKSRKPVLRAADMQNIKTNEAHHNKKDIAELIAGFEKARHELIQNLKKLDDETQFFKSLHPRLQVMMRPVDMAFFTAEHDDHHLVSIRALMVHFNDK